MARTKQTARHSTGGIAPRTALAGGRFPISWYRVDYGNLPWRQYTVSNDSSTDDKSTDLEAGTTSAAQTQVLSSPDVLIIILSQLPHSSLLKARLVNKTWASLFGHVEILASLFQCPRPEGAAQYTEPYSDLFMTKFSSLWPLEAAIGYANIHLSRQWREILVCDPAVEVLELVQEVGRRAGTTIEFRATIHRPGSIRMRFLYDAIRYWHEVERGSVKLLWERKTGDLINKDHIYPESSGFKTIDDKSCITIAGASSVGCGQDGGLTLDQYYTAQEPGLVGKSRVRFIESGGERFEFSMSEPQDISYDMRGMFEFWHKEGYMEEDEETHEEKERL